MNILPTFISFQVQALERYSLKGSEDRFIGPLQRINLFVGPNSSGKSRFLRQLLQIEDFSFKFQFIQQLKAFKSEAANNFQSLIARYQIRDVNQIGAEFDAWGELDHLKESSDPKEHWQKILHKLQSAEKGRLSTTSNFSGGYGYDELASQLNGLGTHFKERADVELSEIPSDLKFHKLYVPSLRGIRQIGNEDAYAQATKRDYGDFQEIFTGQTLYKSIRRLLLGDLRERKIIRDFELFLSKTFFEGNPVALIPKESSEGVVHVKVGDEEELPIHRLGDGVQAIIILMFPLFVNQGKRMVVGFEEPELSLHPGLQRTFVKALLSEEFSRYQYFLTTHSNHLLDLTLDVSQMAIFAFSKQLDEGEDIEKKAKISIEQVNEGDHQPLKLLGVQNSAVFLSNCTIWVEGITDRRYFRHFLKLYWDTLNLGYTTNLKEDLHFSFVEYAGSNITHWSFLDDISDPIIVERLCSRLMLIADGDLARDKKGERHTQLSKELGERFVLVKAKEVENLLPLSAIKYAVTLYEKGNPDFLEPSSNYSSVNLGKFIERHLLKTKKRTGSYIDGNTISDKVRFCDRALEGLNDFKELPKEAQEITIRIHEFILSHNQF